MLVVAQAVAEAVAQVAAEAVAQAAAEAVAQAAAEAVAQAAAETVAQAAAQVVALEALVRLILPPNRNSDRLTHLIIQLAFTPVVFTTGVNRLC